MKREIKFRAWNPDWDEMVYSGLEIIFDKREFYPFGFEVGFSHYPTEGWTIMQYTGLKDGTKWEQLTEQERFDFYNKNKSEDGASIKFQNVDDVKHLWKGKEIYEGDILERDGKRYKVVWGFGEPSFFAKTNETHCNCYSVNGLANHGAVVIGNIYENPEVVRGEK